MGRKRVNDMGLPQFVYIEHGTYYYRRGKTKRVTLGRTLDEAERVLAQIGITPTRMDAGALGPLYWQARKNAKTRDLPFSLTRDDLVGIWTRSAGRCELTGLPFDLFKRHGFMRRPYAPSIDRIDSEDGYTFANCRLVVVAINLAMNEWGHAVFNKIAQGYLRHMLQNSPQPEYSPQ